MLAKMPMLAVIRISVALAIALPAGVHAQDAHCTPFVSSSIRSVAQRVESVTGASAGTSPGTSPGVSAGTSPGASAGAAAGASHQSLPSHAPLLSRISEDNAPIEMRRIH
jgi:hypothetical protein